MSRARSTSFSERTQWDRVQLPSVTDLFSNISLSPCSFIPASWGHLPNKLPAPPNPCLSPTSGKPKTGTPGSWTKLTLLPVFIELTRELRMIFHIFKWLKKIKIIFCDTWELYENQISVSVKFYWITATPINVCIIYVCTAGLCWIIVTETIWPAKSQIFTI